MKIKMQGSELKKVDIEFLSLVRRGANRSPFKVVKTEDGGTGGMVGAVRKFFQMSEAAPRVVAVFVEKSALEHTMPNLAKAGFDLQNAEVLEEGAVLFKQEGFKDCKAVVMIKSEPKVGLAVANVAKYADCFSGSLSFDDNVASSGFYPGLNTAIGALQSTICNILCESGEGGDALGKIQGEIESFSGYITKMLKALPEEVWKFESLQRGFGGATVTPDSVKALTASIVKAAGGKGGKAGGAHEQAKDQMDRSGSDANSTASSELAGSSDDSTDDEASRKAKMAKGANSTVSSETVGEDKARKANGTDTSENQMAKADDNMASSAADDKGAATSTTEVLVSAKKPKVYKDEEGKDFMLVKHADGAVVKYSPGAKIPDGAAEMTMPWDQDGALGGSNNGNGQGQGKAAASEAADNELKYTGAGGLKKEDVEALLSAAFAPIAKSFSELTAVVTKQGETLAATVTKQAEIEKTAKTAVEKAERTVVHVQGNYDAARESLGGGARAGRAQVRKSEQARPVNVEKAEFPDSLWAGALGAIEQHRVGDAE